MTYPCFSNSQSVSPVWSRDQANPKPCNLCAAFSSKVSVTEHPLQIPNEPISASSKWRDMLFLSLPASSQTVSLGPEFGRDHSRRTSGAKSPKCFHDVCAGDNARCGEVSPAYPEWDPRHGPQVSNARPGPPTHGFGFMEVVLTQTLNSRLLRGQRPDDRYLEGLALIGGIHQIRPQAETTDGDQQVDRQLDNEEQAVRDGAQR
jgi:hypothetical protein